MREIFVMSIMNSVVPITRFNKGEANHIFDEVESSGTKIVMKNNRAVCILMSPEKYEALMEMFSDYILQGEAERRMAHFDSEKVMSHAEMVESFGITEADLENVEAEIE